MKFLWVHFTDKWENFSVRFPVCLAKLNWIWEKSCKIRWNFFRFTSLMPKYENVMDLIIIIIHVGLNVQNLQGQQLTGPESILYTQKIILDDRSFTFCKTVCIYVRICSSRRLNLFFQTCLLRCLLDDSLHKYLPQANDSACTLYENHAKCLILQHCERSELIMYFGDPTKRGKNL